MQREDNIFKLVQPQPGNPTGSQAVGVAPDQCLRYGKFGHWAAACPAKKKQAGDSDEDCAPHRTKGRSFREFQKKKIQRKVALGQAKLAYLMTDETAKENPPGCSGPPVMEQAEAGCAEPVETTAPLGFAFDVSAGDFGF